MIQNSNTDSSSNSLINMSNSVVNINNNINNNYKSFHVSKSIVWRTIYQKYNTNFLSLIIRDKDVFFMMHDYVYYNTSLCPKIDPNIKSTETHLYKIYHTGLILNANHSIMAIKNESCKYDEKNCSLFQVFSFIYHLIFKNKDKLKEFCCLSHKNLCLQHVNCLL